MWPSFYFFKSVQQLHKLFLYPEAITEIPPVVHIPVVGNHVDDPCMSLEHLTGRTALFLSLLLENVGDLTSPLLVMESHCHDMLRLPCCRWTRTKDIACNMLCECIFARVCKCAHARECEWLILKFRILTVFGYPRRHESTGPQQPSLSSSSLSPFFHLCPLSFHTSSPFQSNPFYSLLFLPTSLMGLLICNIDIYCWPKWAAVLQVVGGRFWWRSISDRHARLFALSEFTAVVAYTAEI